MLQESLFRWMSSRGGHKSHKSRNLPGFGLTLAFVWLAILRLIFDRNLDMSLGHAALAILAGTYSALFLWSYSPMLAVLSAPVVASTVVGLVATMNIYLSRQKSGRKAAPSAWRLH